MRRKRARFTEITVETHEFVLNQGIRSAIREWCPRCGAKVRMAAPEEAAEIAGVTTRMLYRWVESASIHFVEAGGQLLICLPALSSQTASTDSSHVTQRPHRSKP